MILVSNSISGISIPKRFGGCNHFGNRCQRTCLEAVRNTYSFCKDGVFIEMAWQELIEIMKELNHPHVPFQSFHISVCLSFYHIRFILLLSFLDNKNIFTRHIYFRFPFEVLKDTKTYLQYYFIILLLGTGAKKGGSKGMQLSWEQGDKREDSGELARQLQLKTDQQASFMICFEDSLLLSLKIIFPLPLYIGCTAAKKQIILGDKNTGIPQSQCRFSSRPLVRRQISQ